MKLIIIFTGIFLSSLIFHLWVRDNIKPYIKKNYENLYNQREDDNELNEWNFKFDQYNYPKGENAKITQDSLGLNKIDPAYLKIEKIANYISNYTERRIGTPDFRLLENKSPYEQLQLIKNGESHVWCGLLSFYYSYFLDGADISSRYVSIEKPGDTFNSTHVITEIFIPKENKWIYSDLNYDIIYVRSARGILNLVELMSAINNNDKSLVFIKNNLNNGLIERSIEEMDKNYINFMKSHEEIRYFTGKQLRNNFIPFSMEQKISESIFPSSSYYLFAEENKNTYYLLFAGTRILMILSFIMLVVCILYKSRMGTVFYADKNSAFGNPV